MQHAQCINASCTMHYAPCHAPSNMRQAPCKRSEPCNYKSILYRVMTILCVRFMAHGASFSSDLIKKYKWPLLHGSSSIDLIVAKKCKGTGSSNSKSIFFCFPTIIGAFPDNNWCMVQGACCMVIGAWCEVHSSWCMVHCSWCVGCGAQCLTHCGARGMVHSA